ncbi:MAG TPA: DUF1828 domain-containing protein [Candidatus Cloacimonetes bacterium]|nr:DUF1828 domain-containing protein [Candidatus Cloacimonadota bacterium]
MNNIIQNLRDQANRNVNTRHITESQLQVWLPIYYEDGDMIDIYIEALGNNMFRISDAGLTLMKLSYTFEVNTENKRRILYEMIKSNGLDLEGDVISCLSHSENLYKELIRFGNAVIRVSTMSYFKREIVQNLFYEHLDEFIDEEVTRNFDVIKQLYPLEGKEEYMVDYCIKSKNEIYLYGVKDTSKARLVTICEQTFKLENISKENVVVFDDFMSLGRDDQHRIMNATDKQFPTFPDFKKHGIEYLARRAG